jgi:hypothetical protein
MKKIKMPHMAAFTKMINWHTGYCNFEDSDDYRAEMSGCFSIEELEMIVNAMKEYQAVEAARSCKPIQDTVQKDSDNFI